MQLSAIVVDILAILACMALCYAAACYIAGIIKREKTLLREEKADKKPSLKKPKFVILNNSSSKDCIL